MIHICRAVILSIQREGKQWSVDLKTTLSSWPEMRNRHTEKAVDIYTDKYIHILSISLKFPFVAFNKWFKSEP